MKVADKLRLVTTAEETEQKVAKQFMERERNKDCKEWAGLECFPSRSLLIQNSGDLKGKHQNVRKKNTYDPYMIWVGLKVIRM